MIKKFPEDEKKFDQLMKEINLKLSQDECSIPWRPLMALQIISSKFETNLPISEPGIESHSLSQNWHITSRVIKWYEAKYGKRLKTDMSPGRMVILIEEDPWIIYFPKVYGSVTIMISNSKESKKFSGKGHTVYNALDSIRDMPLESRKSLPEYELVHIYKKFVLGLKGISILQGTRQHNLIRSAIADISSSVDHIMDKSPEYGLSKWSSLQAAEKIFKAAIDLKGSKFRKTHDLNELSEQANEANIICDCENILAAIQCSTGIRYGEESCDLDSAITAQNAVFALAIILKEGGAPFKSSLKL